MCGKTDYCTDLIWNIIVVFYIPFTTVWAALSLVGGCYTLSSVWLVDGSGVRWSGGCHQNVHRRRRRSKV